MSFETAAACIWSSTPRKRKISIDRLFVISIFGCLVVEILRSITIQSTPNFAKTSDKVSPMGPPPTIKTGVFIFFSRLFGLYYYCKIRMNPQYYTDSEQFILSVFLQKIIIVLRALKVLLQCLVCNDLGAIEQLRWYFF